MTAWISRAGVQCKVVTEQPHTAARSPWSLLFHSLVRPQHGGDSQGPSSTGPSFALLHEQACSRRALANRPATGAPHLEPAVAGQRLGNHHTQRTVGVVHLGAGGGMHRQQQVGRGGGSRGGDYHQAAAAAGGAAAAMRDGIGFGSERSAAAARSGAGKGRLRAEPCGCAR